MSDLELAQIAGNFGGPGIQGGIQRYGRYAGTTMAALSELDRRNILASYNGRFGTQFNSIEEMQADAAMRTGNAGLAGDPNRDRSGLEDFGRTRTTVSDAALIESPPTPPRRPMAPASQGGESRTVPTRDVRGSTPALEASFPSGVPTPPTRPQRQESERPASRTVPTREVRGATPELERTFDAGVPTPASRPSPPPRTTNSVSYGNREDGGGGSFGGDGRATSSGGNVRADERAGGGGTVSMFGGGNEVSRPQGGGGGGGGGGCWIYSTLADQGRLSKRYLHVIIRYHDELMSERAYAGYCWWSYLVSRGFGRVRGLAWLFTMMAKPYADQKAYRLGIRRSTSWRKRALEVVWDAVNDVTGWAHERLHRAEGHPGAAGRREPG